jgi:aminoglycoside 6'-N-acetyltransferase I
MVDNQYPGEIRMKIQLLGPDDEAVLERVSPGVFDHAVDAGLAAEFLQDGRHHIAVAVDGDTVVGFASGVHYIHPDKPAELFVNEVGVAPEYRRQGIGRELLGALLAHGRSLGCRQAWVLTSPENPPALRLYRRAGEEGEVHPTVMFTFPLAPGDEAPGP